MMKQIVLGLVAGLVLQACAGGSSGSNTGNPAPPQQAPSPQNPTPGNPAPANPPTNPPPTTQPESGNFFSSVDKVIAASATGDRFVTERFYVLMARLSVYAIICDSKNQHGYSTQFSNLWNGSSALETLAEKVYGSQPAAYNRLEKQRNIESRRISFESGPNVCALSQASFADYIGLAPAQLSITLKTTPRGSL